MRSFTNPVMPGPITCSQKLCPTWPLELPIPFGCALDFDNSMRRVDSSVEAASTTTLACASYDRLVSVSMNDTPRAFPESLSTRITPTVALVRIVRFPVSKAG